jgi:predicted GNAT family acetyltransferase
MTDTVRDNKDAHRFELDVDGTVAFLDYRKSGSIYTLVHTEVPQAVSGRGIGSKLIRGVLESLRQDGARIIVKCPFVKAYIEKHPEFRELIEAGDEKSALDARLDEALTETFPASDPPAVTPKR